MLQVPLFCALALALARFTGGSRGMVAGLLIPGLLASFPFLFNFQFGQFHLAAIMLAFAGMLAFASGWNRTGGALLGAAVVTKIFPGLLLVYLAFQRRGRPVVWTLAFVMIYLLAGLSSRAGTVPGVHHLSGSATCLRRGVFLQPGQ